MPDTIETELRAGTDRVVSTFTPQPAAELRSQTDHRSRRRRAGAAALSVVVMAAAGIVAFNVDNHSAAHHISAAASQTSSPAAAHSSGSTPAAVPDVTLSLQTPPVYSQDIGNKVKLTITNPGPTRAVIVVFSVTTSQPIGPWALLCQAGTGACAATQDYSSGPLKPSGSVTLNVDTPAAERTVRYQLSMPTGTSTYTLWVTIPSGSRNFSVAVLDGTAQLGEVVSDPVVNLP
jgi:hypothetical protein